MDRFKEIDAFVQVMAHGSLAAAALAEGVTPVMMGRRLDARRPAARDPQPDHPGCVDRAEMPAGTQGPRARRLEQWLHAGGNPRGAAALRGLCRRAGSHRRLPRSPGSARRGAEGLSFAVAHLSSTYTQPSHCKANRPRLMLTTEPRVVSTIITAAS